MKSPNSIWTRSQLIIQRHQNQNGDTETLQWGSQENPIQFRTQLSPSGEWTFRADRKNISYRGRLNPTSRYRASWNEEDTDTSLSALKGQLFSDFELEIYKDDKLSESLKSQNLTFLETAEPESFHFGQSNR